MPLYQIGPRTWSNKRPDGQRARSDLPMPMVISDTIEPTEQVDGKFYTSKRQFRAVGRSLGLTEVGNSKIMPKPRGYISPQEKKVRRDTIGKVIAEYKQGRRAKPREPL